MATLGENIKMGRERLNMTQQELARKIRVGPSTIEKYEAGLQKPDTQIILNISTVLDIPASELLEHEFQSKSINGNYEMEELIREIGTDKAKLLLKMAKDLSEEDIEFLMGMAEDIKNKKMTRDSMFNVNDVQ